MVKMKNLTCDIYTAAVFFSFVFVEQILAVEGQDARLTFSVLGSMFLHKKKKKKKKKKKLLLATVLQIPDFHYFKYNKYIYQICLQHTIISKYKF